jgi:hypothetical protein
MNLIYVYASEFQDARRRPRNMMLLTTLTSVALISLPVIAMLTLPRNWTVTLPWGLPVLTSWRIFLAICSLPGLVTALLLKVSCSNRFFLCNNFAQCQDVKMSSLWGEVLTFGMA